MRTWITVVCLLAVATTCFADVESFSHVKIHKHRSTTQREFIDRVGVLTFDDVRGVLTFEKERIDRFDPPEKIEVGYESLEKAVFEVTSHMRGGILSIAASATPLVGPLAGPAIAGQHVQDYWFYIEYMSGQETQQVLLEIPKDSSARVIAKASAIFGARVTVNSTREEGTSIDTSKLADIKSKHRVTVDKKDHPTPEVKNDKATIVVVCPPTAARYSGTGNQFKLHANDQVVAVNKPGTYSIAYLDPGKYRLVSQCENANGFEMQLEAGKTYYFLQNTFEGVFRSHTTLSRNSPELVTYLMSGSKFSQWARKN